MWVSSRPGVAKAFAVLERVVSRERWLGGDCGGMETAVVLEAQVGINKLVDEFSSTDRILLNSCSFVGGDYRLRRSEQEGLIYHARVTMV